jgi:hypothetical protein
MAAVIINELEVVVENAPTAQQAQHAAAAQQPSLEPVDLFDIEERLKQYRLRLLAH